MSTKIAQKFLSNVNYIPYPVFIGPDGENFLLYGDGDSITLYELVAVADNQSEFAVLQAPEPFLNGAIYIVPSGSEWPHHGTRPTNLTPHVPVAFRLIVENQPAPVEY
jgi:hypothetical protein